MLYISLSISKIILFVFTNSISAEMLHQCFEHGGSKNVDMSEKLNSFQNAHGYKDLLITTTTGK